MTDQRAECERRAVAEGRGVIKNGRYFNTGQTYNADGTLRFDFDASNRDDPWFNGDVFRGYDDDGCPIWDKAQGEAVEIQTANAGLIAALKLCADYIKDLDGGDQRSETGWKSDELLDVWLKAHAAIAKAEGVAEGVSTHEVSGATK